MYKIFQNIYFEILDSLSLYSIEITEPYLDEGYNTVSWQVKFDNKEARFIAEINKWNRIISYSAICTKTDWFEEKESFEELIDEFFEVFKNNIVTSKK